MKNRYYISSGSLNKLYTLRHSFTESLGRNQSVDRDQHVSTLTADRETSIAKAREILGSLGHSANLDIDFDLEKITRGDDKDWSIFQHGKYAGKSIQEVLEADKGYLLFACENLGNYTKYKKTIELAKALIADELKCREESRRNTADYFQDKIQERIPLLQELSAVAYYYHRIEKTAQGHYYGFVRKNPELFKQILELGQDWLYGVSFVEKDEKPFSESLHARLVSGEDLSERQVEALFNYIASSTTKKNTDARNAEVENLRATYGHLFTKEEQK
ncbi:MAG: hypothetical protein EBZ87_00630 [Microbacteriaceae bacterium]|nr:hypothetical protein [Microbacteriaceae bacterium]